MNTLNITHKNNYVIVQLQRGRANPINGEMVGEIRQAFKEFGHEDTIRGVIITGTPHFFSAGLDLIELYGYDQSEMRQFVEAFGNMYKELARFPKPLAIAITGHAPAGGCVIAITGDYRIMAEGEKYRIGLNEVAVNIQISSAIIAGYSYWIGAGKAHQYILAGKLLTGEEALNCGLIDTLCPLEEVLDRAEQKMQHYLNADDQILLRTKYKLRRNWLRQLDEEGPETLDQFLDHWWKPESRKRLKGFLEMLAAKKK